MRVSEARQVGVTRKVMWSRTGLRQKAGKATLTTMKKKKRREVQKEPSTEISDQANPNAPRPRKCPGLPDDRVTVKTGT